MSSRKDATRVSAIEARRARTELVTVLQVVVVRR